MDYDADEEAYKARMRKWGMHDKEGDDVTVEDCLKDLSALRSVHKDSIKGILIVVIYDHLDMQDFEKKYKDAAYSDTPPSHSYLCSGGVPMHEAIGAIEAVKHKILS
jgi:hypothetical protein